MWAPCVLGALAAADWPPERVFLLYVELCKGEGRAGNVTLKERRGGGGEEWRTPPLHRGVRHHGETRAVVVSRAVVCNRVNLKVRGEVFAFKAQTTSNPLIIKHCISLFFF